MVDDDDDEEDRCDIFQIFYTSVSYKNENSPTCNLKFAPISTLSNITKKSLKLHKTLVHHKKFHTKLELFHTSTAGDKYQVWKRTMMMRRVMGMMMMMMMMVASSSSS